MDNEIVLCAPIVGLSNGAELDSGYRAVLVKTDSAREYGRGAIVRIEQQFKSGNWGGCGEWYLETLLENCADQLAIDFGQQWSTKGMRAAIIEAAQLTAMAYAY